MITLTPNPAWLDGVVYDEPTRCHYSGGVPVPSVTQVLKTAGLTNFDHVRPDVLERKASLGRAVHAAAHYHDEADLDATSVTEEARLRLAAWCWFLETRRPRDILLIEAVVCSRDFDYVGRLDRLLIIDSRLVLLDLSNGKAAAARKDLQTAGYQIALLEQYPELRGQRIDRWGVELRANGRYTVCEYPTSGRTYRNDRSDFLSAVAKVHELTALAGGSPCWS